MHNQPKRAQPAVVSHKTSSEIDRQSHPCGYQHHLTLGPARFSRTMPSDAAKNASTCLMKCRSESCKLSQSSA
eukprot:407637-Amphidinium_carterae.1